MWRPVRFFNAKCCRLLCHPYLYFTKVQFKGQTKNHFLALLTQMVDMRDQSRRSHFFRCFNDTEAKEGNLSNN